jgi:1,4-dihydroxy-2-naphthoyl-CoA synthase
MIDARQAEQRGLINGVVPLEESDNPAMDTAKEIAQKSALAIELSRASLNLGIYQDIEQTLE